MNTIRKHTQMPSEIKVNPIQENTVILTFLEKERIFLTPDYQRTSDVWSLEKKQLLIDSIINGFDIPKFYFHEYENPKTSRQHTYKYALIDGKQRLTAIWEFIDDKFPLDPDFKYLFDPSIKLGGLYCSDLGKKFPKLLAYFNGRPLSLMAVRTDDIELIEDMFSRLNEAMPLNAPEKRNAFGGPLPPIIRELVKNKFFINNLPFSNKRYRHFDLACKFLYLMHKGGADDTKKRHLDSFVREFKSKKLDTEAKELYNEVMPILKVMSKVFTKHDELLKNTALVVVYFLLFRQAYLSSKTNKLSKSKFIDFEKLREANRIKVENEEPDIDYDLLRFEEVGTSLNDKFALEHRYKVLWNFFFPTSTAKDFP